MQQLSSVSDHSQGNGDMCDLAGALMKDCKFSQFIFISSNFRSVISGTILGKNEYYK